MNLSNIATQERAPSFELLQPSIAGDENVQKIYHLPDLLSDRGKDAYLGQVKDTDDIGWMLQVMQQQLTMLTAAQNETLQAYEALAGTHRETLQQLSLLQERINAYDRSILDRMSERMAALGNGYINLKAGIRDHAADFVLDFRINGKETSARALELFDIEGKLQWMRGCIANGIYELQKSMDKRQKLVQSYQAVYDRADHAMQEAGKDNSLLKQMAAMQRDAAAKQAGIFEKLMDVYQSIGNHLDSMINRISEYVKDAHRAKNQRMADKLQQDVFQTQRDDIRDAFKDMPEIG